MEALQLRVATVAGSLRLYSVPVVGLRHGHVGWDRFHLRYGQGGGPVSARHRPRHQQQRPAQGPAGAGEDPRPQTRGPSTHCTSPLSSSIVTKTAPSSPRGCWRAMGQPPPVAPGRRPLARHRRRAQDVRRQCGPHEGHEVPAGIEPQRPVLPCHLFVGTEVRQGGDGRRHRQGALAVSGRRDGAFGRPERPPAVGRDRTEGPRFDQRSRRLWRYPRVPHQVGGAGVGPVLIPLLYDPAPPPPARHP